MLNIVQTAELQFEPIKEIGIEGKNSQVYLARDLQLNAELVVKKIAKTAFAHPNEYFAESSILYRSEHPNVVPVYYGCQDSDHIYVAMPFLKNGSLNALINSRFLTVREIIKYSVQFLSGLHNVHSKKLIHFDIKPDNILLSQNGEAVLSDFGLARHMAPDGAAEQALSYFVITPPERMLGHKKFDFRYDIYQAGCTLYRMCVGNDAFYQQLNAFVMPAGFDSAAFKDAVLNENFPNRKSFPAHIPRALQKIVTTCLHSDVSKRYSSVLDLTNALAKLDCDEMDWQYSVKPDGTKKWERKTDGKTLYIELDAAGIANAQKAAASGKFSRMKDFCGAILPKKISDFFKEQ